MAWTVDFNNDTEKPGVGTVTAVDDASGATYSRRVDTNNAKDVSDFCSEARQVATKIDAVETNNAAFIAKVFAELTKV